MRRKAEPWDIDLYYDLAYNLFVTCRGARPRTCARRTSTPSTRCRIRAGSPTASARGRCSSRSCSRGPVTGPAPAPAAWTVTREKSSGDAPGFTATDAKGQTWFVSFDAPVNPDGATGALVIATKIFWALGYNQVEYFLTDFRSRGRQGSATRRRSGGPPASGRRMTRRRHPGGARARAPSSGRVVPRRRRPAAAGQVLGGFKYEGTRPDDPERRCPARASARAAGAARVRRVDQPDRHEGRQHARHRDRRGRPRHRAPLPPGRRLDLRRRRQRTARLERRLGVRLRGRAVARRLFTFGFDAQPLADRDVRGASGRRPLRGRCVRSRDLEAARADRPPTSRCATTMRSGRRGG